ncbi:MAG: hypothetical protein KF838_04820 [Phycisphaeraceae bacterium]|nr:MAG: hypothetical protein KF838_04820 [Phycisphaeraceae bacterium]
MITRILHTIIAWAIRNPSANPSYGEIATGHVAAKIARGLSTEAAEDFAKVRKASVSKHSADHARNEAIVCSAQTKAELDNMKKRAAALKESDALAKRFEAATDDDERAVLTAELTAARMARFEAAYERLCETRTRIRMKNGDVLFDISNLQDLVRIGTLMEKGLQHETPPVQFPRSPDNQTTAGESGAPAHEEPDRPTS